MKITVQFVQVGIVIFQTGDGYDLHEYYLQNHLFSSLLAVIAQTKEMKNRVLFNLVQAGKILRGSGALCNVLESHSLLNLHSLVTTQWHATKLKQHYTAHLIHAYNLCSRLPSILASPNLSNSFHRGLAAYLRLNIRKINPHEWICLQFLPNSGWNSWKARRPLLLRPR